MSEETRLLIAPVSCLANASGRLLSLRHPKSGSTTSYLLVNGMLHELQWFKQCYTSWFLGDYVCEDGGLHIATPIDPIFMFLPIFEEARMKKGDDPGKFRRLDEIISVNGYPGYSHLISMIENCMGIVCEMKEIDSLMFFRLDDSKVLTWLRCKVMRLIRPLSTLDKNYGAQDEKSTSDAVAVLAEYLKDDPWLKLLCNYLKLDSQVLNMNRNMENDHMPLNYLQSQDNKETHAQTLRSIARQAKKVKLEASSHSIKDMFLRASNRK